MKDDVPPFERYLACVRAIGAQRPMQADHAAFERFMAEFHQAFPQATADQYVRAKHVAAAAAGVLIGYGGK